MRARSLCDCDALGRQQASKDFWEQLNQGVYRRTTNPACLCPRPVHFCRERMDLAKHIKHSLLVADTDVLDKTISFPVASFKIISRNDVMM